MLNETTIDKICTLYKELGGQKKIPLHITDVQAVALVAEQLGWQGSLPINPVLSDAIEGVIKALALPDSKLAALSLTEVFGYAITDIQTDVVVSGSSVTGTSKYLDDGQLVTAWGEGNFIGVEVQGIPADVTSIKLGMFPTYKEGKFHWDDSGLVDITDDPDKGGVFKITDKSIQKIKIVTSDGTKVHSQLYDLKGVTLLPAEND